MWWWVESIPKNRTKNRLPPLCSPKAVKQKDKEEGKTLVKKGLKIEKDIFLTTTFDNESFLEGVKGDKFLM